MRSRRKIGALVALVAAGVTVPSAGVDAQSSPVGVWNIQSNDMTDRATGGVRVVLLRVQQANREFDAEITSIRNTFMPVDEFRWDDGMMHVTFGAYEYALRVDGDRLVGTMTSPLGTQQVQGERQYKTLMYVGDEGIEFRTQRTGVLGLASDPSGPANDDPDPHAWVTGRMHAVDDLAILNGRARVPVQFDNARDFEAQLRQLAGTRVTIVGVWVGEKIHLESIRPATP
ncbi:MAG: hypothetical protein AB7T31_06430 [Gemmatimonadales bacterium]